MKNHFTYTSLRIVSLSWYIGLFIIGFSTVCNSCGCNNSAGIDASSSDTDGDHETESNNEPDTDTAAPLSLQFEKLSYDPDKKCLVAIIKNTGKETAKDLSLRGTNICQDKESQEKVTLNNQLKTTTLSLPELAIGSSTPEISVAIDFQTADKAVVQMDIIGGEQQVIITKSIPINQHPISLRSAGSTMVVANKGEPGAFGWQIEADGTVDFTNISLKVEKVIQGGDIDVSVAGTPIVLNSSTDSATITGVDVKKLSKQPEISVKVTNNTTIGAISIHCTLLASDKEIARIVNVLVSDMQAALHLAVGTGNVAFLQQLLENGANASGKGKSGETPLTIAARQGFQEIVAILIENGAKVNEKNADGQTPVQFAAQHGKKEIVTILIEKGAEVNEQDHDGWTALHLATIYKQQEIMKLLLENGAKVNLPRKGTGSTALHLAAEEGYQEIVQLLLEKGADKNILNNKHEKAANIAATQEIKDLINNWNPK